MHLYKSKQNSLLVFDGKSYLINQEWDTLINQSNLHEYLKGVAKSLTPISESEKTKLITDSVAPIGNHSSARRTFFGRLRRRIWGTSEISTRTSIRRTKPPMSGFSSGTGRVGGMGMGSKRGC